MLALAFGANAQQMQPGVFNFGKVQQWNNPKAVLKFTNNGSTRVLFLPVPYQRNLYVHLPQGYISPGESVEIEAIYYTENIGKFEVNQPLYLSGWSEPVYLRLSGKIQSFHPDAHIACPNMGQRQKVEASNGITQLIVKDKETGELLNGVDLLIQGNRKNFFIEKTRQNTVPLKKLPIGLYQIDVSKPGYQTRQEMVYINKNTNTVIVELERNPFEYDVIEEIPSDGEDEIIEIEKPQDSDKDAIERLRKIMDEKFKGRTIIEKDVMVLKEPSDSSTTDEEEHEPEDSGEIVRFDPNSKPPVTREPETPNDDTASVPAEPKPPVADFSTTGELNPDKYASNNVVFLIDESSSMMLPGKMDLLQKSMKELVSVLRKEDMVSIIVYSKSAEVRLKSTPGNNKDLIFAVIDSLDPGGRSYGSKGLSMAYGLAKRNFIASGNNQIILATDGLFNSPEYSERDMYGMAQTHASIGIKTTVVGFGRDKDAILFMENLSSNGKGSFIRIKSEEDARNALLQEIMSNALR